MKKFGLELDQKWKQLMVEIIVLQKTSCAKIGINTYDLHLNEPLKFLTLEIIIKCASKEGKKLFLQIYLNQCLYEL